MVLKMACVQTQWKLGVGLGEVPIYGGGELSLIPRLVTLAHKRYRSVHNCRIERLWLDYSHGIVAKWKPFFMDLEAHHKLDYNNFAHIWLLHHLFLNAVDSDTQAWVRTWNLHRVTIPEGGQRSPHEMFLFGMVEYGSRGIDALVESEPAVDDLVTYGVDWGQMEHAGRALQRHPEEWDDENPFLFSARPEQMSEVVCDEPDSPLSYEQIRVLDQLLCERVDVNSPSMEVRKLMWAEALSICEGFQVYICLTTSIVLITSLSSDWSELNRSMADLLHKH